MIPAQTATGPQRRSGDRDHDDIARCGGNAAPEQDADDGGHHQRVEEGEALLVEQPGRQPRSREGAEIARRRRDDRGKLEAHARESHDPDDDADGRRRGADADGVFGARDEGIGRIDEARASAERWCRDVAGARVHGTTREVPREVFEARERSAMKLAPTAPFDVPHWTDAKVHPDHHVQVLRSLYSVPTRHVGSTVRVRADSASVRIYAGTELVKVHARVAPGKRSTDPSDYPMGKDVAAVRDVASLIASAKKCGVHVGVYAERLLAVPLPWTRMRLE